MMLFRLKRPVTHGASLLCFSMFGGIAFVSHPANAAANDGIEDNDGQLPLPSGQYITPLARVSRRVYPYLCRQAAGTNRSLRIRYQQLTRKLSRLFHLNYSMNSTILKN